MGILVLIIAGVLLAVRWAWPQFGARFEQAGFYIAFLVVVPLLFSTLSEIEGLLRAIHGELCEIRGNTEALGHLLHGIESDSRKMAMRRD